tara:strand:- start:137223 stop:137717 length:495 start_codon:yes stop_codon:yes gene_type:complete
MTFHELYNSIVHAENNLDYALTYGGANSLMLEMMNLIIDGQCTSEYCWIELSNALSMRLNRPEMPPTVGLGQMVEMTIDYAAYLDYRDHLFKLKSLFNSAKDPWTLTDYEMSIFRIDSSIKEHWPLVKIEKAQAICFGENLEELSDILEGRNFDSMYLGHVRGN